MKQAEPPAFEVEGFAGQSVFLPGMVEISGIDALCFELTEVFDAVRFWNKLCRVTRTVFPATKPD